MILPPESDEERAISASWLLSRRTASALGGGNGPENVVALDNAFRLTKWVKFWIEGAAPEMKRVVKALRESLESTFPESSEEAALKIVKDTLRGVAYPDRFPATSCVETVTAFFAGVENRLRPEL